MLRRRVFTDTRSGIVIDNAVSVAPTSVTTPCGSGCDGHQHHEVSTSSLTMVPPSLGGAMETTTSSSMLSQRRHSLKYTRHITLPEMHQPAWMRGKHEGSTEKYLNPTNYASHYANPKGKMHMHQNTWYTDTDITNNHIFNNPRNIKDYNLFMGTQADFHTSNKGFLRNGIAMSTGEANETVRGQKESPLSPSLRRPNSTGYDEVAENEHVALGQGVKGYHSRWAFKGRDVTAFANLHWEPYWNPRPLYDGSSVQAAGIRSQSRVDLRDQSAQFEVTVPATSIAGNGGQVALRSAADKNNKTITLDLRKDVLEIKSKQHVEEFWERLKYLIEVHRPAVGDLQGEAFKSRFIRNVHDFFVVFQDAVSTHDFQDSYMLKYFEETRPKGMEDLFGIFLEMESNYIHEDHCPRCSLPFATTRFCGEGDENTPFREHRGRWAPHKAWSKEWYQVVERRAEQLWYRAVEDPHFGAKDQRHTQKQAEELLKVYCKTKSRGKAISFLVNLRGSLEYLEGTITITPEMQAMHDALLDTTPHPHLLTNSFKTEPAAAKYLLSSSPRLMNATGRGGAAAKGGIIPQSAMQFRIDLEMSKFRREQKEEGAVRLPPAGWSINTNPVIEYRADPRTGHITNWRDVKAGIEQSFLDTGVAQESYTSDEIREIAYLTVQISQAEQKKQALREQLEGDKREAGCKFGKGGVGEKAVVFPDRDAYRVYKITADAFKTFDELLVQAAPKGAPATPATTEADIIDVGADAAKKSPTAPSLRYGAQIDATYYGYPNPSEVTVALPVGGASTNVSLDITAETCRVFSGYEMGQVLEIVPTKAFMEALQKMGPGAAGRLKAGQKSKVVILGVSKEGLAGSARAELVAQELPTLPADGIVNARTALEGGAVFSLGSSIEEIIPHAAKALNSDIVANFTSIAESLPSLVQPPALSLVQKERQPAGRATVIGVRAGQLWVQFDSSSPQQATVAVSLGSPISLSKLWNISLVGASSTTTTPTTTVSPVEPFSWNTPFRNDWAVERLAELKKAPWSRQRYVSLIENKFTPKVKKFGYTQHITQDDFITKEYQDRLTSRQFFNSPQSFEVIPDANVKSVRFSHKDEGSLKLSGLPGADRNEVENGWSKQEVMNDFEINEVEQALKDISGRRPGNYIKTEVEKSSLELNETWWSAFRPGWKGRNAQQMLLHPSERRTEDGSKYAFRGNLPPIGTSYGMADRIREIVDDYSRGFGLGPTGQGPLADQGHFNTLGFASAQASVLGHINPIVRLFDEKISKINGSGTSIEQQVFDWCTLQQQSSQRGKAAAVGASAADRAPPNPRNLLLDIKEWREAGRPPSVHLTNMLQDLLKQEVAEFNAGVPAGVPKIHLEGPASSAFGVGGSMMASSLYTNTLSNLIGTSTNNNDIWADVDRFAARSELHNTLEGAAMGLGGNRSGVMDDAGAGALSPIGAAVGTELNGYILTCVVHAATRNSIASTENSIVAQDDALGPACQHTVIAKFLTEVSSKIGKGIDTLFMQAQQATRDAPHSAGRGGNQRKMEHSPKQLILLDELRDILLRLHVSSQITDSIIKGLRNHTSITKDAIPVSDLIGWAGPGTTVGTNNNNAAAVNNTKMGDAADAASSAVAPSLAKTLGVQGGASDDGMLALIAQGTSTTTASSSSSSSSGRKPAAPINPALWNLLRVHDGRALDILVAARQNKQNSVLYEEFLSCVRGVTLRGPVVDEIRTLAGDDSDAFYRGLFERYTDGTYAPSLEEAVTMFTNFLTTTLQPGMESALRSHFFRFPPAPVTATGAPKLDESNRLPMLVKPLPVSTGIHYFDSVRANVLRLHAELEAAQIPNPEVYREYPFTPTSDNLIKAAPSAAGSAASSSSGASSSTINVLEGKLLNHALGESIQKLGASNPATAKYWNRLASFQDGALARRLFFGLFSRSMPLIFEYADLAKYVLDDGKATSDAALSRVLPLLPTHTGNTSKGTAESYPTALTKAAGGVHPNGSGARAIGANNYAQNTRSGTGEAAMVSQTPSFNKLRHIYNTDSISPINAGARLASATSFTILDTTHATSGRPAGRGGSSSMENDEGFGSGGGGASEAGGSGGVNGAAAYDEQLTVSRTLHSRIANDSTASARDMKELGIVLANDANAQIELDFKRNAERYWKRIIDGSSGGMLEELSRSSGGGGGGGRGGGGGNRTFTSRGGGGGGGDRRGFGSSAPGNSSGSGGARNNSTTVGNDKPYNQRGPYRGGGGGGSSAGGNRSIGSSSRGGGGGMNTTVTTGGGGYSKPLSGSSRAGAGRGGGGFSRGGGGVGLGNLARPSSSTPAQK